MLANYNSSVLVHGVLQCQHNSTFSSLSEDFSTVPPSTAILIVPSRFRRAKSPSFVYLFSNCCLPSIGGVLKSSIHLKYFNIQKSLHLILRAWGKLQIERGRIGDFRRLRITGSTVRFDRRKFLSNIHCFLPSGGDVSACPYFVHRVVEEQLRASDSKSKADLQIDGSQWQMAPNGDNNRLFSTGSSRPVIFGIGFSVHRIVVDIQIVVDIRRQSKFGISISTGHIAFPSNGALLQLLEGCYFEEEKLQKANVLISFNNKPAADAVPYFEQVGPMAAQFAPLLAAAPFYEMATNTSRDALETMLQAAGPVLEQYNPETILSLTRFTEQIPSVMNQITQGVSEFKPTPSENRQTVSTSYKIPRNLLVKFNFDTIDETDVIEAVLRPRIDAIGGSLAKVVLNGTHITPCGQDLNWQVGDVYTPRDAVAQGLKGVALNDIKTLVKTIADWLKSLN